MNWKRPLAVEFFAEVAGSRLDSTLAVASRYSKLAPVARAALRMAPAMAAVGGRAPAALGNEGGLLRSAVIGLICVRRLWANPAALFSNMVNEALTAPPRGANACRRRRCPSIRSPRPTPSTRT